MKRRDERVVENLSFWSLLKTVKIKNITWKYPIFYVALATAILSHIMIRNIRTSDLTKIFDYVSNTITSVSATLMGIIIAGLAIIVALSMGEISALLLRQKILQKLLFPFWFITFLWSVSTFVSILFKFIPLFINESTQMYIFSLEVFIFSYALFGTVGLIGSTIKIMLIIAQLVPKD